MQIRYGLTIALFISLILQSCSSNSFLSDRTAVLSDELEETIQDFEVDKTIRLRLEHSHGSSLDHLVFLIALNHPNGRDLIFKGTKKELERSKIPIPKPHESNQNYYVSVRAIDETSKTVYKWSADVAYPLSDTKINTIRLIYSDTVDESITLKVW